MLTEIEPYDNNYYEYNDYVFFENSNFHKLLNRSVPKHFTMACYNDTICTLIFLGMDSLTMSGSYCLEDKYLNDIEGNWNSFIDQYFGEIYDFSK